MYDVHSENAFIARGKSNAIEMQLLLLFCLI